MSDVAVRRARVEDAAALARAYRSAYRENARLGFPMKAGSATEREVADWIRECRVFVATVAGQSGDETVVGGVRLEGTEPNRVTLSRLGVHEAWQGEGVGSRLLDRAEAAARDAGYAVVRLTTPPDHPYLPDLYRRRGYERTGAHPLDFRAYDEIVMEKELG